MLTFRNTNILFVSLLLLLIVLQLLLNIPIYIYFILLLLYSLLVFYGCTYINSGFFLPVICSAKTAAKEIAISFDDGPLQDFTPGILKLLKVHDIKATFFCIGNRVKGNELLLEQMLVDGHLIGNHSFSHHFWFDMFSSAKMLEELKLTGQIIKNIIGSEPKLFRPPYGVINPNLKTAIIKGGYTTIGWNLRSRDTVIKDTDKLLAKLKMGIRPGAVFLFHDHSETMLACLPQFIKEVKNQGYRIIPLDKLLFLKPYA